MFGIRYVGHVFFVVYAIFCIYYAVERVVFIDSAKYLFDLINYESLSITGRAGGYPVLILPLLLIKLKLSLYIIIVSFSVSYAIVFYLIFLMIIYLLKSDRAAWLLLFSLLLCTRDTFYYPATEVYIGVAYVCLLYAVLFSQSIKNIFLQYALVILFVFICSITHPVTVLLILPVLLIKFIETSEKYEKAGILGFSILTLIYFVIKPFTANTITATENVGYKKAFDFFSYLPNAFSFPSANFFYIHSWQSTTIYLTAIIFVVIGVLFYLFQKQFLKASVIFISATIIWLLAVIVYNEGESAFVLGKAFVPLAFICAFPLFHDILQEKKKWLNVSVMIILICILLLKYRDIALIGKHQKARIKSLTENINAAKEKGINKAIIKTENIANQNSLIPWAYSMESILLSSFDVSEESTTIFIELPEKGLLDKDILNKKNVFLYMYPAVFIPQQQLNRNYFNLPETEYVYLK